MKKQIWLLEQGYTTTIKGRVATPPIGTLAELRERIGAQLDRQSLEDGIVLLDQHWMNALAGDTLDKTLPWQTLRTENRAVHIGQWDVLHAMDWPWGDEPIAGMQTWADLSGQPWNSAPGAIGQDLMHKTMPSYRVTLDSGQRVDRRPQHHEFVPEGAVESPWIPGMWLGDDSGDWDLLQGFDRRRAGLVAAGAALLPARELEQAGPWRTFDPTRAGWWQISVPTWENDHLLPHPCGPDAKTYDRLWVTTPTLALVHDIASRFGLIDTPEVIESWTSLGRQFLRPWQQKMETVYQAPDIIDPLVRTQLKHAHKQVYTHAIGMLGKYDGKAPIHNPTWMHTCNAAKRAGGYRTALKVGLNHQMWPIAIDDDSYWYKWHLNRDPYTFPLNFQDQPGGYRPVRKD